MTIQPDTIPGTGFDEYSEFVDQARGQLLAEIAAGIAGLQRAANHLERLRTTLYDVEFAEGRDGRDVATFLDDSIRIGRAAYAVVHAVIDKETPR